MLNTLPVQPGVRSPRGLVFINGQLMAWTKIKVDEKTFYEADTFDIDLPLNAQANGFGLEYFSSMPAMLIEVYAGFPPNLDNYSKADLTNILTGQVDDVTITLDGTNINLIGRDLTAKFIDNKTTEKFQNMTASQIATLFAQRRGLTPIVTPTSTKAGYFYGIDHARMTNLQSEWDLLTFLAQESNFVVYVQGQSLYFKPQPEETDNPYVVQYTKPSSEHNSPSANAVKIELSRNLTLARDIIVKVRSKNSQYPQGFTRTAKATPNKKTALPSKAQPIGDAQVRVFEYDGLTIEQAEQKAQQLLRQLSQHERKIRVTMPADNLVNKDVVVKLQGTDSDFDQVYFPAEINHELSAGDSIGYRMTIAAKNHSPNSEVLI
jgi:phage protein D